MLYFYALQVTNPISANLYYNYGIFDYSYNFDCMDILYKLAYMISLDGKQEIIQPDLED